MYSITEVFNKIGAKWGLKAKSVGDTASIEGGFMSQLDLGRSDLTQQQPFLIKATMDSASNTQDTSDDFAPAISSSI